MGYVSKLKSHALAARIASEKHLQSMGSMSAFGGIQLATVVDSTLSMAGHVNVVSHRLCDIVKELGAKHRNLEVAAGYYRDHDEGSSEEYDVLFYRNGEFQKHSCLEQLQSWLLAHANVQGGGDAEAMGAALAAVSRLKWTKANRVLVHVGDQPSHGYDEFYSPLSECPERITHEDILSMLKGSRVKAYMVQCRTIEQAAEQYQEIAHETGGRYIHFDGLSSTEDLLVIIEAAIIESTGGSVVKMLEDKKKSGKLTSGSAQLLLEAFNDQRGG